MKTHKPLKAGKFCRADNRQNIGGCKKGPRRLPPQNPPQ
jgi:hypothetical protein